MVWMSTNVEKRDSERRALMTGVGSSDMVGPTGEKLGN